MTPIEIDESKKFIEIKFTHSNLTPEEILQIRNIVFEAQQKANIVVYKFVPPNNNVPELINGNTGNKEFQI